MSIKDKLPSLLDVYSLALVYSSHKNYCDRVCLRSTAKCTCEYDEKRASLKDIPFIVSEIEKQDSDKKHLFNASNIGFMNEVETGKIFLIDRNDYERCVQREDFNNIKRVDVTASVKMMFNEWFKSA